MEPTIIIDEECWIWEVWKIAAFHKKHGRAGWYAYTFSGDTQTKAEIHILKIKPFWWRRLMTHELHHHKITQGAKSFEEAKMLNVAYDQATKHGLCEFDFSLDA